MTLQDHLTPYIDPETGLVKASDGGRDNLPLFTMTALALEENASLRTLLENFLIRTKVATGLWERLPGTKDNSVDNLVATALVNEGNAHEIIILGMTRFWCFNPQAPNKFLLKYYFGRFIGFAPHVKACAGQGLSIFSQVLWAAACVFASTSDYGNTSDKCLQYLMNKAMKGKYKVCDLAISRWKKSMAKKYPGGMAEVYSIYFGKQHPFALYGPKDFE